MVLPPPGTQTWRQPDGTVWAQCHAAEGASWVDLPGLGRYLLGSDLTVWGTPLPDVTPGQLEQGFIADALPLLHQANGGICLHASAVTSGLDEPSAIAFVGRRMAGKSTLAAAWEKHHGLHQVADDIVVLYAAAEGYVLQPLPFTRRLRPASCEALDAAPRQLRPAWSSSLPVTALFFLVPRHPDRPMLEAVPAGAALPMLLEQSVCFLLDSPERKEAIFHTAVDLLSHLPLWQLRLEHRFDALATSLDAIKRLIAA